MTTTQRNGIDFLRDQHARIRQLLEQVGSERGEARQRQFDELRRLLAVHETAEELVIRPRTRQELRDGARVADQRMAEENKGKEALAELEKLEIDSPEFDQKFIHFKTEVLTHAEHEETEEFPELARELSAEDLDKLAGKLETAEATAPTHPHPSAKSSTANAVLGPFAAIADRVRDALSRS